MIDIIDVIQKWERDGEPVYEKPEMQPRTGKRYAWPSSLSFSNWKCNLKSAFDIVSSTGNEISPTHTHLLIPENGGENYELQRLFSLGNYFEERVLMALIHSGIEFKWNESLGKGRYDFYIPEDKLVIEVKFTSSDIPSLERLAQIGVYMLQLGVRDGELLFINSKNYKMRSFYVYNNPRERTISVVDSDGVVISMYNGQLQLTYEEIYAAEREIQLLINEVVEEIPLPPYKFPASVDSFVSPCTKGKVYASKWQTQCYGTKVDGNRCSKVCTNYPVCNTHESQLEDIVETEEVLEFTVNGEYYSIDLLQYKTELNVDCPFFGLCWGTNEKTITITSTIDGLEFNNGKEAILYKE